MIQSPLRPTKVLQETHTFRFSKLNTQSDRLVTLNFQKANSSINSMNLSQVLCSPFALLFVLTFFWLLR